MGSSYYLAMFVMPDDHRPDPNAEPMYFVTIEDLELTHADEVAARLSEAAVVLGEVIAKYPHAP